jgi:hypothetical protein
MTMPPASAVALYSIGIIAMLGLNTPTSATSGHDRTDDRHYHMKYSPNVSTFTQTYQVHKTLRDPLYLQPPFERIVSLIGRTILRTDEFLFQIMHKIQTLQKCSTAPATV